MSSNNNNSKGLAREINVFSENVRSQQQKAALRTA